MRTLLIALTTVAQGLSPAAPQPAPEAISLFGKPLYRPAPSEEAQKGLETQLAEARAAYDKAPDSADAIIWLGRRTAYLGRYRDAIAIFSEGIQKHPGDPRMYRHRGHRYISTRQLDRAVGDLTRAAELVAGRPDEVEPDGQPNARSVPTSTLQSNIFYHLGLAHYLRGDFDQALQAYERCMTVSKNPDMQVATAHWLYMTLRRLGRDADAARVLEPITPGMTIIENGSYYELLLMYKGAVSAEALLAKAAAGLDRVTLGYGVGNWHLYNGRRPAAAEVFRSIVATDQWPAFGYIAAEADLARLDVDPPR